MKCKHPSLRKVWQTFKNGTKHLRLECATCSKLYKYLPQQSRLDHPEWNFFVDRDTRTRDLQEIEQVNVFA